MKKKITIALLILYSSAFSQKQKIDTLRFSTKSTLLTFEGKINGVETQFAFDTGASVGAANSVTAQLANIEILGNKKITDSNNKSSKIARGLINEVTIGSFKFKKVSGVVFDMPFLYCNKIYLLGGDLINKLNWKIDFVTEKIYISNSPFPIESDLTKLPIKIKNNRHFSFIYIKGKSHQVLVDFGYVGYFETNYQDDFFSNLLQENRLKGLTFESKITSMGLMSTTIGVPTTLFKTKEVQVNGVKLENFYVSMSASDKEAKVGLSFFKTIGSSVIINKGAAAYYLKPRPFEMEIKPSPDAQFYFIDGKLITVSKIENNSSTARELTIGEEIKSIDSRVATSFKDECEFFIWKLQNNNNETYVIEKMNNEKLIIKRQKLPVE